MNTPIITTVAAVFLHLLYQVSGDCSVPNTETNLDDCCPERPELIPEQLEETCMKEFDDVDDPTAYLCMVTTCIIKKLNVITGARLDKKKILDLAAMAKNISSHWKKSIKKGVEFCHSYMIENSSKIKKVYSDGGLNFELDICNPEFMVFAGCIDMKMFNSCQAPKKDEPGCVQWINYYKTCPLEKVLSLS